MSIPYAAEELWLGRIREANWRVPQDFASETRERTNPVAGRSLQCDSSKRSNGPVGCNQRPRRRVDRVDVGRSLRDDPRYHFSATRSNLKSSLHSGRTTTRTTGTPRSWLDRGSKSEWSCSPHLIVVTEHRTLPAQVECNRLFLCPVPSGVRLIDD